MSAVLDGRKKRQTVLNREDGQAVGNMGIYSELRYGNADDSRRKDMERSG